MEKRKALLIGVGNYDPDSFKNHTLNTPPNNVAALQEVLVDSQIGFFDEVYPLVNPNLLTMQTKIEDIFIKSEKSDLVLLYFSGHGIKDESNKLYLTNCDTKKYPSGELAKSTAVSSSFILDIMASCSVRRQIIILDSCFSGAFPDGIFAMDDDVVDIQKYFGGEGRAILTATSSTNYALEKEREDLSVYTKYLVKGLKTGIAAPEDKEIIAVKNIHDYVFRQVRKAAPAMKPEFYGVREGDSITIAKALRDPELTYRKKVERRIDNGKITATGKLILEKERIRLKLSKTKVEEIIEETLKPYREREQNIQEYKIAFQHEFDLHFPFNEQVSKDLKDYQKILNLRDEDVKDIEPESILGTSQFKAIKTLESILNAIPKTRLYITIVTGFLGSGKTTLTNRIIKTSSLNIAVSVMEFGEIGIEKDLYKTTELHIEEFPKTFDGSCSTCNEILENIKRNILELLDKEKNINHLIIETTGLADPLPIALTFLGTELRDVIRLDSIITMIDSSNSSLDILNSEAARSQTQYGDIILLNKTDLVDSSDLEILESRIRDIKQDARILHSCQGQVPLSLISDLTWNKLYQNVFQNEELSSISLFSFESDKSLNIRKFQDFLDNKLTKNIFRAVGILWFKESPAKHIFYVSGKRFRIDDDEWKDKERNQLVFFGQNIDRELLNSQLKNCLSEDIEQ
ncbi:MAG: GTP-binding protein [Cyanobacteria bacterium P01_F01_bin.143]